MEARTSPRHLPRSDSPAPSPPSPPGGSEADPRASLPVSVVVSVNVFRAKSGSRRTQEVGVGREAAATPGEEDRRGRDPRACLQRRRREPAEDVAVILGLEPTEALGPGRAVFGEFQLLKTDRAPPNQRHSGGD